MAKYKAYPEYKESGVEWLGKVPSHWEILSAKRMFQSVRTPAYKSDEQLAASQKYGVIPQSLMMQLNDSKVMLALKGTESFRHVEANNFVISLRSFEGGIEYSQYTGCVSPAYTVLKNSKPISYGYYRYLLKCTPFIAALQSSTDSLRDGKSINYEQFSALSLPLSSVQEQSEIAAFLDHETAKIDNLIEKQQQLIELLKEKRQAVISHAVTKGLNPDVPMKDSGVEWLGDVPTHWGIPKLLHVTKAIGDGLHSTPKYDIATGYYFINGNNLVDGKISIGSTAKEVSRDEYNKHYVCLDKKTVLLSINGTIGNVAIYNNEKVILGKSAAYINCGSELDVNYLMYYFITNESRYYFDLEVTGTTIFNLSLNSIRQMKVCIPPLEEQRLIVKCCVEKQKQYNYLIDSAEMAIKVMQERRTALISAAVTGKIDVRDWVAPDTQGVEEPPEATA
ncbi:restriction endonuclease subunit S [Klebsiella quasipneumoniae]|uniref:restriction endonuclease subunit S n=1 Tax=Klebsiella quasipneumoniae TaxID=1463165 RepID=UPI0031D445B4